MLINYHKTSKINNYIGIDQFKTKQEEFSTIHINYKN
jgi:hypothetical protein